MSDHEYTILLQRIEAALLRGEDTLAELLFFQVPARVLVRGKAAFVARFSRIHRPGAGKLWDSVNSLTP